MESTAASPVSNVILLADCYKFGHYKQYPPGTTHLYSYFESRGGKFPYTCFFGLQYILKRWLVGPVVTKEAIEEAKVICNAVYRSEDAFNEEGWNHILKVHGGRLPLRIKAVAEGTVLPTKNVLFTVENTDPAVPWLTSYFETVLVQTWYPMTVATVSRISKQVLNHYLEATHGDTSLASFSFHDCGYRGVSSVESAAIGGAANMIHFQTSDTVAGTCLLRKYYHLEGVAGYSGSYSEHSCVTSWGRDNEARAHEHLIKSHPGVDVGCVVDSYDIWHCLEEILGGELKELVKKHGESGAKFGVRPDSGDHCTVTLKCLEILGEKFGTETNSLGYRMLAPYLRLAQGDGMDYRIMARVLEHLKENGWSAATVGFGAGAALLQKMDRDTLKCAYKCSLAVVDEEEIDVYKQPVTDPGKTSKKGRLSLHLDEEGKWYTAQRGTGNPDTDQLVTVFENGELLRDFNFEDIRQRAADTKHDIDIIKFLAQQEVK